VSFLLAEQKHKIYGDPPCHRGDVVLDCGAHVGFFTRDALNAGAGKVVAIEPSPTNFECLRRNFAEEIEAGKVVIYPKGVWHRDEEMMIEVHAGRSAQDKIVEHQAAGASSIAVPLTTIDKLVEELGLDRVDLIKMDIEGAEANALKGAKNTIAKFKPRLSISGYHREDDPAVLPEIVGTAREDYRVTPSSCMGTHEGRILISHVIFFK